MAAVVAPQQGEYRVIVKPTNFVKNLVYGGTAGIIGAFCTFPIDTAKTRVQAETGATRQYKHIGDALVKIFRAHGLPGLYRGLQIQAVGIIPEKALKLSVNDSMRYLLRDRQTDSIALGNEALAGGIAGFCQVIVTSPMEMLKIRLQMQATLPKEQQRSAMAVIMDVVRGGLPATFRGASATLLRDVFFSMIYFPFFSNTKAFIASRDHTTAWGFMLNAPPPASEAGVRNVHERVNMFGSFMAGLVAGSVSGWLATPADVIKTRLQAPGGKEKWVNIRTCAAMTLRQEGPRAFFKGATARVFLIGPLFGIVLATYEVLPRYLPL